MQKTETKIVKKCLEILNNLPVNPIFAYKTWGNAIEMRGRADITGIIGSTGRRLEYEIKTPRGKMTKKQKQFLRVMYICGAVVGCCDGADKLFLVLPCKNKKCEYVGKKHGAIWGNICPFCGHRKGEV